MALKPPYGKIYADSIEETPVEKGVSAEVKTGITELPTTQEHAEAEKWTGEDEQALNKLKKELEEITITSLRSDIQEKVGETGRRESNLEIKHSPNELLKGAFEQLLRSENLIKEVGPIAIKGNSSNIVLTTKVIAESKGLFSKPGQKIECRITIVLEYRKSEDRIEIMQQDVEIPFIIGRSTKKEISSFLESEEKKEGFSKKIKAYAEKESGNKVTGVYIKDGKLKIEFQETDQPAIELETTSEDTNSLLEEKATLETKLEDIKKEVDLLLQKKARAEKIVPVEKANIENKGEATIIEEHKGELEDISQPIELSVNAEKPKGEPEEISKPIELSVEQKVETGPASKVATPKEHSEENLGETETIKEIKEGTKISYEDAEIGGIYIVNKIPSTENGNKYLMKGENGRIFKPTESQLKNILKSGKMVILPEKNDPVSAVETENNNEEKIESKENASENIPVETTELKSETDIKKENTELVEISPKEISEMVSGILIKVHNLTIEDVKKSKNNLEQIEVVDSKSYGVVKGLLDDLSTDEVTRNEKNKLVGVIDELADWAKNPEDKKLHALAINCITTLAKVLEMKERDNATKPASEEIVKEQDLSTKEPKVEKKDDSEAIEDVTAELETAYNKTKVKNDKEENMKNNQENSVEMLNREILEKEIKKNIEELLMKVKDKKPEIKSFALESTKNGFNIKSKVKINKTGNFLLPKVEIDLGISLENKSGKLTLGTTSVDAGIATSKIEGLLNPILPQVVPNIRKYFEQKYGKVIELMKIEDGQLALYFKNEQK